MRRPTITLTQPPGLNLALFLLMKKKKFINVLCDWLIHQYGKPKKKRPPPYSYWKKSKMHFFGPSSGEVFCHHFRHHGHCTWFDQSINGEKKVNFLLCDWLIHQYGKPKKKTPPPTPTGKSQKCTFLDLHRGKYFATTFAIMVTAHDSINQSMGKKK